MRQLGVLVNLTIVFELTMRSDDPRGHVQGDLVFGHHSIIRT